MYYIQAAYPAPPIPPTPGTGESWLVAKLTVLPRTLVPAVAVAVIKALPTMPTYLTETKHCSHYEFNPTCLLPGQALLAHVDQGGSSRLVQLNSSGGIHGNPIGLQQQCKILVLMQFHYQTRTII